MQPLIQGDVVGLKKRTDYLYIWRHNEIPVGLLARCLNAGVTTVNNHDKQNEEPDSYWPPAVTWFISLSPVTNTSTYVDHKGILLFHLLCCSHLLSICWSNFRDLENAYQPTKATELCWHKTKQKKQKLARTIHTLFLHKICHDSLQTSLANAHWHLRFRTVLIKIVVHRIEFVASKAETFGRYGPTFRRNLLAPLSGNPKQRRYLTTELHDDAFQSAIILIPPPWGLTLWFMLTAQFTCESRVLCTLKSTRTDRYVNLFKSADISKTDSVSIIRVLWHTSTLYLVFFKIVKTRIRKVIMGKQRGRFPRAGVVTTVNYREWHVNYVTWSVWSPSNVDPLMICSNDVPACHRLGARDLARIKEQLEWIVNCFSLQRCKQPTRCKNFSVY